jgi:hypothetical protein
MTEPQQALGWNPSVGYDANQGWHKDGNEPLHGKERTNIGTHANITEIDSHASQIGSPYGELQEVHDC